MTSELIREILRSMRNERNRWDVPKHGWAVDLLCHRNDGLEVMQDRLDGRPLRIQSDNHSFEAIRVYPKRFGVASSLMREMESLHREKLERNSDAALKAIGGR